MNLLVTIDENYILPFKVMLSSFFSSNPQETDNTIYLLHSAIPADKLADLEEYCAGFGAELIALKVPESYFIGAATSSRYPKEMYYRMLAPLILPADLERVLYLDPDILVLNPLEPLYSLDLQGNAFAAACHTGVTDVTYGINALRLDISHDYFNTGVILFDLTKARELVKADEIFQAVKEHENELILPDQDIFNILYGEKTLQVDDTLWNYDARKYTGYLMRSEGEANVRWIMDHTALLHFCGKHKPWNEEGHTPFNSLYLHYMNLTNRRIALQNSQKQNPTIQTSSPKEEADDKTEEILAEGVLEPSAA